MNESELSRLIRRAKRWNYFFLAILLFLLCSFFIYKYQHTFTSEKWINNPNNRVQIVDDMLKKNNLVGMNITEIKLLLGEETHEGSQSSFKISNNSLDPNSTLTYYLGVDYMDGVWLVISYDKDDIITSYRLDVT